MPDQSPPPLTRLLFGAPGQRPAAPRPAADPPPTALPVPFGDAPTRQRPALPPDDGDPDADVATPTAERGVIPASRAVFPTTLSLPVIPKDQPAETARTLRGTPPASALTRTPTLPPVGDDHEAARELTAPYAIVMVPGARRARALRERRGAPRRRPGADRRIHRFVLAGFVLVLALGVIAIAPLSHNSASPLFNAWLARASNYDLPTAPPPPTATPVVFASHPYASGVNNFICVALPFARLAQQRMQARGFGHPWYVSVILAQWGFEQGWRIPGYTGYNWGNVGAIAGYPAVGGTGAWGSPNAFAYAYSAAQGVEMYVIVAGNGYYGNVTANYGNGPRAQALALGQSPWDAGHYAESGGAPGATLLAIMSDFNLFRFDNPAVGC